MTTVAQGTEPAKRQPRVLCVMTEKTRNEPPSRARLSFLVPTDGKCVLPSENLIEHGRNGILEFYRSKTSLLIKRSSAKSTKTREKSTDMYLGLPNRGCSLLSAVNRTPAPKDPKTAQAKPSLEHKKRPDFGQSTKSPLLPILWTITTT